LNAPNPAEIDSKDDHDQLAPFDIADQLDNEEVIAEYSLALEDLTRMFWPL